MLKDKKSTKIILLVIVILLMLIPSFRIFHLRGGFMRDGSLDRIDLEYDNVGILQARTTSGDILITYDEAMDGIAVEAEHGSSNIGGSTNNLTISTVCDDIIIKFGPNAVGEIRASSTSGEIEAIGAELKVLDLSTTSGSIKIRNVDAYEAMTLSSTSGSVDLSNSKTDILYVSALSGNIDVENTDSDEMTLASKSGSIESNGSKANHVLISTTSGNTRFQAMDEYMITVKTTSGKVKTDNGTISLNGTYGKDTSPMKIDYHTTSGNLTIN